MTWIAPGLIWLAKFMSGFVVGWIIGRWLSDRPPPPNAQVPS